MAFEKRSMVVLLMMVMGFCGLCSGAVYKVGDKSGWTDSGKVDYKSWAASKNFRVGDTIVFQYDNRFSNVIRVNHKNYDACNNRYSYFSLNSGNDSFIIPRTGHFYFISGLSDHCKAGQRVDIRVPTVTATPSYAPAYAPAHSPAYAPAHSPAHSPAHAPAHAPGSHYTSPWAAHAPAHAPGSHYTSPWAAHAPAHAPGSHYTSPWAAPAPAHAPAHAPGSHYTSPWAAPAPAPKKHNGAVSISGTGLALVAAIAVCFYGFSY